MRTWSCIPVLLLAALAAAGCAQPQRASGPDGRPQYLSGAMVEVQNNSTVTISVICRPGSGRLVRLGTLDTGEVRRYEIPRGCTRVSGQTLSGRSVVGVVVRYLKETPENAGAASRRVASI